MSADALADRLKMLSATQLDFVQARMFMSNDKEAAAKIGISHNTVYNWPNLDEVRACILLAKQDSVNLAAEKLRRLTSDAVDVLADELQARRGSSKRLDAAVEILNRTIGKPTDKHEVSGVSGGALEIVVRHVSIPLPEHSRVDSATADGE